MSVDPYTAPSTRVADPTSAAEGARPFLVRCWSGEARLWEAFWLVLVLGNVATNLIAYIFLLVASQIGFSLTVAIGFGITVLLNLTVLVFALVSVWRCALKTRFVALKLLSRALVIAVIAVFAMQLVQGIQKGRRLIEERREQQQSSEWPSDLPLQGSVASRRTVVRVPDDQLLVFVGTGESFQERFARGRTQ